jgi:hypothetical protein
MKLEELKKKGHKKVLYMSQILRTVPYRNLKSTPMNTLMRALNTKLFQKMSKINLERNKRDGFAFLYDTVIPLK